MLDQPLWTPSPIRAGQSNLARLMAKLKERHGVALSSYADIHAFSVEQPELFWDAVWDFGGVKASARGTKVLEKADRMLEREVLSRGAAQLCREHAGQERRHAGA